MNRDRVRDVNRTGEGCGMWDVGCGIGVGMGWAHKFTESCSRARPAAA